MTQRSIDNPFLPTADDPRDREERLFEFLAAQVMRFRPEEWRRHATRDEIASNMAFTALMLSNITEQLAPEASDAAYAMAATLLGHPPELGVYRDWLRQGQVDVNRLAGYLDQHVPRRSLRAQASA